MFLFFLVIIHLEASNKWPLDVNTIGNMVTMFYLELSRALSTAYSLFSAPSEDFVDVWKVKLQL